MRPFEKIGVRYRPCSRGPWVLLCLIHALRSVSHNSMAQSLVVEVVRVSDTRLFAITLIETEAPR